MIWDLLVNIVLVLCVGILPLQMSHKSSTHKIDTSEITCKVSYCSGFHQELNDAIVKQYMFFFRAMQIRLFYC